MSGIMTRAGAVPEGVVTTSATPALGLRRKSAGSHQKRGLQAKLEVGADDDRFEHEADRTAEQVMRGDPVGAGPAAPMKLQRVSGGAGGLGEAPAEVQQVLSGPGSALDAGSRAFFESRFGHDFSRVRVHHDAQADASARQVGAKAYTVGQDVVFAAGQYDPHSRSGQQLMAHELAHVLQQTQPGGQPRMALKRLEPLPGATPAPTVATPVRGEDGAARVAAAIELLKRLRDQVTAAPARAAAQQRYVLAMIEMLSQHVLGSRMTPAFAANEDARADARRCEEALGALRFLETGFRVAMPNLGDARSWNAAIGAMQRAQAPLAQLLNYMSPKERYKAMVSDAQTHGMPVKMLNSVAKASDVAQAGPTDDERYEPRVNRVYLKERSLRKGLQATDPVQADSIGALYHESTHAFLSKHREEEPYKSAIDAAIGHYTGAPVGEENQPTNDPYRLVQEASAEYVEKRVLAWWSAYGQLNHYASTGVLSENLVAQIRKAYQEAQTEIVHGYDETLSKQRKTSRPMSEPLIELINHDLLEDKIARPFDEVPQFRAVIESARAHKQMGTP